MVVVIPFWFAIGVDWKTKLGKFSVFYLKQKKIPKNSSLIVVSIYLSCIETERESV